MFYFPATWPVFTISIFFFSHFCFYLHTVVHPFISYTPIHRLVQRLALSAKMNEICFILICAQGRRSGLFSYPHHDSTGADGARTRCDV